MTNHFESTIENLQAASQQQKPEVLIDSFVGVMQQQSGSMTPQELGKELAAAKTQIVKAFNQRQQGG